MSDPRSQTRIDLVPHTHWDREWYRPFQSFRMQLVELIDRVLEMLDAEPDFAFTLDGQLATVDDYLEVRPDQAERIAAHVRSGRLAVGPWLILMDEFLVSGETMVRNLEMGMARAEELGGPMCVGYLPDMFGHIAQMPQILRRAGLADAVVWRGVPAAIERHAFRWESPDGSHVRAEYLPDGYGNAAYLFAVPERLAEAAGRFVEWSRPWFGDDVVLAMYGTDHAAPIRDFGRLVSSMNELVGDARITIRTLSQYIASTAPLTDAAPTWRGELRAGARANVLMGVTSARIDIKQAAGRGETLLERYAEPLAALHLPADAWPEPFLRLAWRRVVENSAHDSICGCSVDPVVDQVLVRFAEAEQIAGRLAARPLSAIASEAPRNSVVAINPSPTHRDGLVEIELQIPSDWDDVALELPDGRRLATQEVSRKEPLLFEAALRGRESDQIFRRFHGREIFDHSWNAYRIDTEGDRRTLTFEVDDDPEPAWLDVDALRSEVVAAMSSAPDASWLVRIEARPRRRLLATLPAPALGSTAARPIRGTGELVGGVGVDGHALDNGLLRVTMAEDGSWEVATANGSAARGVGQIEDGGDAGDSYNYAPPSEDRVVTRPVSVRTDVLEAGPVRGVFGVTRAYDWPVGLQPDSAARSDATVATSVVTQLELRSGEPFVRVTLELENRSDDHRVRIAIPTPRTASGSHAAGQFAVVERSLSGEGGYHEEPLATFPAHGWVDAGGVAILLDHVTEYEVVRGDGGETTLMLTILRSIGLISRNANSYRQDPAGPELAIPDAQMRGQRRFGFAVMPHPGDWQAGGVAAAAERYRHPFLARRGSGTDAAWPPPSADARGLELRGDDVVLSSLRRRADGWIEARVVNLAPRPTKASFVGGCTEARGADLLGRPGAALSTADGNLELELGAAEIRTVQLRRRETARSAGDLLDSAGPRRSS